MVEAGCQRDMRDASVYDSYTLPKLYMKMQYCCSCGKKLNPAPRPPLKAASEHPPSHGRVLIFVLPPQLSTPALSASGRPSTAATATLPPGSGPGLRRLVDLVVRLAARSKVRGELFAVIWGYVFVKGSALRA